MAIEFDTFITPALVEEAYRQCKVAQHQRRQSFADTGWRAAQARDPKLLKALEIGAETLQKMSEQQFGRTMRTADEKEKHKYKAGTTEEQLWREAYRLCDEGNPIQNLEWIYGAAAWLCGYNV
mgnify:CR=1 FL=1|jgi:hypothetical protein